MRIGPYDASPGVLRFRSSCVAFLILAVGCLYLYFGRTGNRDRWGDCQQRVKAVTLAILMYNQDNDERFPLAANWMDAIHPEFQDSLHCPSVPVPGYGYAFDSRLAGVSYAQLHNVIRTGVIYDSTNLMRNASDPGTSLPEPGRHNRINSMGLADGHTCWILSRERPMREDLAACAPISLEDFRAGPKFVAGSKAGGK
jgi:hypothetical protein